MNRFTSWRRTFALAAVLLLASAGAAVAQTQQGNLFGTVKDTQGANLPGVRVELTGIGAPQTQFTNAQGQFRFLNLDPGSYQLTTSLEGFSTVEYPAVSITVGRNTTLEVTLSPAVEEVITVTSESPLLDERRISKGTTVSQIELEKIPTARDPWAVLTQTPGVLADRINVGGNQSGQQSNFIAPGTNSNENSFAVDGVVITDMAAIGSSPTYYDFDWFEEIQVSTGGTDIEKVTAGASMNLVTKRGSNNPRGSARYFLTNHDEQFGIFEQSEADIQRFAAKGDGNGSRLGNPQTNLPGSTINEILDYGFEAGGPILRDRLWVWGSYGRNDIKQFFALTGNPNNSILENTAIKLNGQFVSANSAVGSWHRGDKLVDGRLGVSNRSLEATWDQDGPSEIWKLEDTHVFSSDFYLTGMFSYVDGGFQLQSKRAAFPTGNIVSSGATAQAQGEGILDVDGIYRNGWYGGGTDRNTDNYQVDGSYFFNTGNLNHELKFGVSYREFDVSSHFGWPGGRNGINYTCESQGTCGFFTGLGLAGDDIFISYRTGPGPVLQEYTSTWLQDTLTSGNWTINAGVRYDQQDGANEASSVAGSPVFPNQLVTLDFPGNDAGFEWETFSPRVGVTYALGAERKTLLRASFARFAEQLSSGDIGRLNPVGLAFVVGVWGDTDGNNRFNPETGEPIDIISFGGFNPADPSALSTPNVNDPNLDPEMSDELLFGIEHALLPEFVIGADVTWRNTSDVKYFRPQVFDASLGGAKRLAVREDFQRTNTVCSDGNTRPHLPDGTPWCATNFGRNAGLTPAGSFLTNSDRDIEYLGATLHATKRLSNRWMARGYVNYGEAEWSVPDSFTSTVDPNLAPAGGDVDGQLWVQTPAASGPVADVIMQSSWSFNLNGMYQLMPDRPWGVNLAGELFGREGYPLPYFYGVPGADGTGRNIRVSPDIETFRTDDVYILNLRVEKDMAFTDNLSGILSLDAFNVGNNNDVLQRTRNLTGATANFVTETVSPRIYRLGFRLNWR